MTAPRITASLWLCLSAFLFVWTGSAAALAVLAATVCTLVLGGLMVMICGKKCTLAVSLPQTAAKGDTVPVEIRITNRSVLPVCLLRAELQCSNRLTGEYLELPVSFSLGPKGTDAVKAEVKVPYCGYMDCRMKNAAVSDCFSLYKAESRLQAQAGVYIMPQLGSAEVSSRELYTYNMESYQYSPDQRGNDPGEIFGIREYEEGDSLRAIHWKLSGKMGELMVRELGLPVENSIMILLEKGMEQENPLTAKQRDKAAELFLSLSHALLEHQMVHSAGWQDYRSGRFVLRKITSAEDLWAMSGLLMESPYKEDPVPVPIHYLEHGGQSRFSHYLYVTAGSAENLAGLENQGAVTVYRA